MHRFKKVILQSIFLFVPSLLLATTPTIEAEKNSLAVFYKIKGDIQKPFNEIVQKELKTVGFNVTDPHKRVNDQYKKAYGSTVLDVLSFMSIVNDEVVLPLLNIDPRIAGFSPFNMLIYKKLNDEHTHVGHLTATSILDMLEVTDATVREKFTASFKPLNEKLEAGFKAKGLKYEKSYLPYKKLTKTKMINFEFTFERPEDLDDFIDDFQNEFELAFIDKSYLIAGYHNFMEGTDDAEEVLKDYDAFWTYSLCHLEYSYNMFDNKGAHPEAGLFAPCSMYMYIRKDSNVLVLGMPTLQNWSDTLGIEDKKRVGLVHQLDKEIPSILTALGMTAVPNENPLTRKREVAKVAAKVEVEVKTTTETPKVTTPKAPEVKPTEKKQIIENAGEIIEIIIPTPPKVPSVIQVRTKNGGITKMRSIQFSKRIPPNYVANRGQLATEKPHNTSTHIGQIDKGRIAAYIRGEFIDVKTAEETLKKAGFVILSVSSVNKKGDLISIVFTDKSLTTMASKKNRGFMASLHLLVNKKDHHISITNPLYLAKAFMQEEFNDNVPKKVLEKITSNFKNLLNSKDMLKFQLLPKYQFMNGMPQYQDMITVATGTDLLAKAKKHKRVVFTQQLENGSTLIGIKLRKRTNKFTSKIGTNNAGLLPYPILIEDGKAKIMDPKYYISVMYPLLQMSEFMTIATVPGAIETDSRRVFK